MFVDLYGSLNIPKPLTRVNRRSLKVAQNLGTGGSDGPVVQMELTHDGPKVGLLVSTRVY